MARTQSREAPTDDLVAAEEVVRALATTWDEYPPVLTLEQVAEILHVSRSSAYEAHRRGQVPGAFKIGRRLRFSRDAIRKAVEGQGA